MKKRAVKILLACLILLPLATFSYLMQWQLFINVTGGNGTSDGEQVNRDYEFTVSIPPACTLTSFKVMDQNSTSFHQVNGNKLNLVWKSSYVGTTQTIRATCTCLTQPSLRIGIETYTLHN